MKKQLLAILLLVVVVTVVIAAAFALPGDTTPATQPHIQVATQATPVFEPVPMSAPYAPTPEPTETQVP